MKFKTVRWSDEDKFDAAVNRALSEGWTIYSVQVIATTHVVYHTAYLTMRDKPRPLVLDSVEYD